MSDADSVARRAAQLIAEEARSAVAARGQFLLATSGGSTPWRMLEALAREEVPWARVHLFQVDERVVPDGHIQRNLTHLETSLLSRCPIRPTLHAMPVRQTDLVRASADYAATLRAIAGAPPVLDLIHLGLGEDGHTASLVAGEEGLGTPVSDVAVTKHNGYRRLTLTLGAINRARFILWLVTGALKGSALARLRRGDRSIPAGLVRREDALILTDSSASRAAANE